VLEVVKAVFPSGVPQAHGLVNTGAEQEVRPAPAYINDICCVPCIPAAMACRGRMKEFLTT